MKIILLCLCATCCCGIARADDAYIKVYGGAAKLMSTHPSIRMTGEDVEIVATSTSAYQVEATFRFWNSDKSTTVLVGFPMGGYSPEGDIVGEFLDFKTFVNGKEISTLNNYKSFREERPLDEKWKVKEVYFRGVAETVTRVKYSAVYGRTSLGKYLVHYIIGTGGSWAGSIGVSTFTVTLGDTKNCNIGDPLVYAQSLRDKVKTLKRGNSVSLITSNFEPNSHEMLSWYLSEDCWR